MRVRRVVAAVAVVALVASGCSSQPPGGELELEGDDAAAAPVSPDPPVETTEEAPEPPEDEQLYPPLPPLEPDPNSDIPVEAQEAALERHGRTYDAMQSALSDPEFDLGTLSELLADPVLSEFVQGVEARRADGVVARSPDTTVEWVVVASASGGPIVIEECRHIGPATGTYDVASGEPVELVTSPTSVVFSTLYEIVESGAAVGYRAIEITSDADPSRCDA